MPAGTGMGAGTGTILARKRWFSSRPYWRSPPSQKPTRTALHGSAPYLLTDDELVSQWVASAQAPEAPSGETRFITLKLPVAGGQSFEWTVDGQLMNFTAPVGKAAGDMHEFAFIRDAKVASSFAWQGLARVAGACLRTYKPASVPTLAAEEEKLGNETASTRSSTRDSLREWARSVIESDPRHQLADFFRPGDERGPLGYLKAKGWTPNAAKKSHFFAVWRPTSRDAIRMMMEGRAKGKGMNVKGKSAKTGKLSGFVPFIQIHKEQDKRRCATSPKESRLRVYFPTYEDRHEARSKLEPILEEMTRVAAGAQRALDEEKRLGVDLDDETKEGHLENLRFAVDRAEIDDLDEFGYGLELPERLLVEAFITKQDISHREGWQTGRPSEPAYMDLNLHSAREVDPEMPRVVVLQFDPDDALNPNGLVVAYEELGKVCPVASDFDAFLIASQGVDFTQPLPPEQVEMVHKLVGNIQTILETPGSLPWTQRWLEVLKKKASLSHSQGASSKQHPPKLGFGDPQNYAIMEQATEKLNLTGAVRHGAECFNYYFPQDLDDEYLIVDDQLTKSEGKPYLYVSREQLKIFLLERIAKGFCFPLNPKWVLCDPEYWWAIYEAMLSSPAAAQALECWLPQSSELRGKIAQVHAQHPDGFMRTGSVDDMGEDASNDADLAELAFKRYMALKRAKLKLRCALTWVKMGREARQRREALGLDSEEVEVVGMVPPPGEPPATAAEAIPWIKPVLCFFSGRP